MKAMTVNGRYRHLETFERYSTSFHVPGTWLRLRLLQGGLGKMIYDKHKTAGRTAFPPHTFRIIKTSEPSPFFVLHYGLSNPGHFRKFVPPTRSAAGVTPQHHERGCWSVLRLFGLIVMAILSLKFVVKTTCSSHKSCVLAVIFVMRASRFPQHVLNSFIQPCSQLTWLRLAGDLGYSSQERHAHYHSF